MQIGFKRKDDVSDLPNPFAPDPAPETTTSKTLGVQPYHATSQDFKSHTRQTLISSLKLLGLLVAGFVGFSFLTQRGPDWLATRLTSDFQSLDSPTKQARLTQLFELGTPGIDGLVLGLTDSDPAVALRSRNLIRDLQTSWISMPAESASKSRQLLTQSLESIDASLPAERQTWVREMIQQAQRTTTNIVAGDSAEQPVIQAAFIDDSNGQAAMERPRARVLQVRFDEPASDANRIRQPAYDLDPMVDTQPLQLR